MSESEVQPAEQFVKVLAEEELEEGGSHVVRAGVKRIALFKLEGEIFAVQDTCPHAGGSLGAGPFSTKRGIVRCPRHAWGFDVKTGECKTKPSYCLKRYAVRREDGWISVGMPNAE